MTNAHTPGPWIISDAQIGYFVVIASGRPEPPRRDHSLAYGSKDPRFYRREPLDYPVVSVSEAIDTVYSLEEATANARLIAASPDLLEALQAAEAAIDWVRDNITNENGLPATHARIRAAIAKAT